MIPREIIEEIKYRNDIRDVVSSYVSLKPAGSNLLGLCPFHSERTPSFTVFLSNQNYYCFGCGAGGDVITFIMKMENLDYTAALEFLAKRAGITIPQDASSSKRPGEMDRTRVYDMNREAAKFFRNCLFDDKLGAPAREYLSSRGLDTATVKRFGLGFSPDSFNLLRDHMHRLGYTDEELTVGFLCGKSKKTGRSFDYFRNRIMFPIIDVSGNVVAFGGRVMDGSEPKYLNTSDTPGFKKSRNLFALNFAKNDCAEQLILCEGYMDVISLHAAGFGNAVATLGTAITQEQARIMARYTKKVIISYDSDKAGKAAASKAMNYLSEVGLDVKILKMEGAKDPDEYIKKFGADKFKLLLSESRTSFEYKLEDVLSRYDIKNNDEKIKALKELCFILSAVNSAVEREVYIFEVAKKFELPADVIRNDVKRIVTKKVSERKKEEGKNARAEVSGWGDRINVDAMKNIHAAKTEEVILGLLLLYEDMRSAVKRKEVDLVPEDFFTEFGRRVFVAIIDAENSGGFDIGMLGERFTPDEMGRITKLKISREKLTQNSKAVLSESAAILRAEREKITLRKSGNLLDEINSIREKKKKQNK